MRLTIGCILLLFMIPYESANEVEKPNVKINRLFEPNWESLDNRKLPKW